MLKELDNGNWQIIAYRKIDHTIQCVRITCLNWEAVIECLLMLRGGQGICFEEAS
jgi:hypothetical protein